MVERKRKTFLILYVISVIATIIGCKTLNYMANTYNPPIVDPDFYVDIYHPDRAWNGTTLFADQHNPDRPRIVEVNMRGEIVWEYVLPGYFRQYTNPGFDVERLSNNNILFVLPRNGVYEIDRNGKVVWSHLTKKISHDADRLPDGNTIFVYGAKDEKSDAQVTEINSKGKIVSNWYARDHFDKPPYKSIYNEGWTHTNAVSRLANGNTLVSLRNFKLVAEVDPRGSVVRTIGEGILGSVHDPEILPNGNLLATIVRAGETRPAPCVRAVEIEQKTGEIIWQFEAAPRFTLPPVRDANRLPNGNTLIVGATAIIEVTSKGEIVWRLRLREGIEKELLSPKQNRKQRGFYKAERIGIQKVK